MEKDIKKYTINLATELKNAGIPVSDNIIDVTVNKRAKKRLGCCRQIKDNGKVKKYVIEISHIVTACDEKALKTIIVHELLHTCPGCFNHGKKWKQYSQMAANLMGIQIKRTADYLQLGISIPEKKEETKYFLRCSACGQLYERKRMCPLIKHPERYRCGKCGNRLG